MDASDMGNYPISLQSIQLNMGSNKSGQPYLMHFKAFDTVYAAVPAALKGDLNGDGLVNAADVTTLIRYIIEGKAPAAADLSGDGLVNVADVTALVNQILAH